MSDQGGQSDEMVGFHCRTYSWCRRDVATMVYAHMNWQERDDTIVLPMKVFLSVVAAGLCYTHRPHVEIEGGETG